MYTITLSDLASKQLKKLNKELQIRVISTIERCRIRPYAYTKKVVGGPYFALRVGDYRVVMRILNNELRILVVKIGHRKRVYKR